MFKRLICLFILMFFSITALGCGFESLVKEDKQICAYSISIDCQADTNHSEQDPDHSQHQHLGCMHFAYIDVKPLLIVFNEATIELLNKYSFSYKNLSLETRKRPPLAS